MIANNIFSFLTLVSSTNNSQDSSFFSIGNNYPHFSDFNDQANELIKKHEEFVRKEDSKKKKSEMEKRDNNLDDAQKMIGAMGDFFSGVVNNAVELAKKTGEIKTDAINSDQEAADSTAKNNSSNTAYQQPTKNVDKGDATPPVGVGGETPQTTNNSSTPQKTTSGTAEKEELPFWKRHKKAGAIVGVSITLLLILVVVFYLKWR